ncbi:MAG: SDR family oxidoreductase [Patescibacteria group bacterium]
MNLKDKVYLVTGATSGIGKETATALSAMGGNVVFTARSAKKGEETLKEIVSRTGNNQTSFLVVDFSSLSSVRQLACDFARTHNRLDALINNAGVMEHERKVSRDGFEMDFAVNYLAPFLLTKLLLPLLKSSAPSRIVNVSSSLHGEGKINFEDMQSGHSFDLYKTYAQSKLALILFTKKLAHELSGTGVTANALNPGVVTTKMTLKNIEHMNPIIRFFYQKTALSVKRGAETSVYLAVSPEVEKITGEYFEDKKIKKSSSLSKDNALAEKIWNFTEKLVGRTL